VKRCERARISGHATNVAKKRQPHCAATVSDFQERLLAWFNDDGRDFPWRRKSATRYHQIVAEVLLQRTRADVVGKFLPKFLGSFPCWEKLARATEEDLKELLQPLGLWRRRAASLRKQGTEMASRRGRFPLHRQEIESLPGVGQYIANAIMLFCHGTAEPLLDVNMARVLERYFGPRALVDIRYDPYLQTLARKAVSGTDAVRLNWAILDLAAMVCTIRRPKCVQCPLASGCLYGRQVMRGRRNGERAPGIASGDETEA
jgi:A/G-specific adenine glycosylase